MKTSCAVIFTLIVLLCLAGWVCPTYAGRYTKIALVHSYEEGNVDAERTLKILKKELQNVGVNSEIREYYLDCDEYGAKSEEERASLIIDDLTEWGAVLVAVLDDQATYSIMACNNPLIRDIPVVFSGVNYPNEELLQQYPNVTGYVDIPDYLNTVRMVERIMGKSRICVLNGQTFLDHIIWQSLCEQCAGHGYEICDGGLDLHVYNHRTVRGGIVSLSMKSILENEKLDTTAIVRLETNALSLQKVTWAGRGSRTLFLFTKRDFTTVNSAALFRNPCFETINEGFGVLDHKMGGYFAPLETQLKDMAGAIVQRLHGQMPEWQVQQSAKQYVLNWHTLHRYNIPLGNIPSEYIVMYIPFTERYHYHILFISFFGGAVLLALIFYLFRSLRLERRRKREAQRNLRYEHETLSLAIEGAATYAWRMDGEDIIFDSQFNDLIHHPHKLIELNEILRFIHPDDRSEFLHSFKRIQYTSRHKGQYRCNFTGKYQWWEFRYNTIHTDSKPVITGLLQNIQDVKDWEDELIQARKLAEHAELKQSFLNNMSHEIRTPLNAIAGFSNMLVSDVELSGEEKQEFVDIINLNTRLLLKLVDDVLELARIESGTLPFNLQDEDVRTMLENIYLTHQLLIHSPLQFLKDFPDENVSVYVDSMRLTQVLTNFLNNANKFTSAGYIKIGYSYVPQLHEVRIYIEDTGIGISAEEQKIIFERFYKHSEFSQGVGLGLSICMLIVDKMEGRIEVESEVGKGSRFTVILPCADR
ncbi:HAMP domain-containing sensor histidine kinase [Bacteroides sp.]|uniref:sensor histidine kinase n=1 Tax=Bacteroides sp. TaxID=29523 RepID=UPI00262C20C7|nr:HAMP domain-containing sensor histidine kinase [Bacteroides sp.]